MGVTQAFSGVSELAAIIPETWASESLGYLQANVIMASLVRRDFENQIARFGDVVNLSSRSALVVKSKAAGTQIDIQAPTNTNIAVQLTAHKYVAFGIEDIAEAQASDDVMAGYVEDGSAKLAEDVDSALLALYADAKNQVGTAGTNVGLSTVGNARLKLNIEKAPMRNRACVWSPKDEAALIILEQFSSAEKIGDDGTAMREASLGRILGFGHFMNQQVKTSGSSPLSTHNLAFHRDAMALVSRPLPTPPANMGAASAIINKDDISLRFTAAWSQRDMATVAVLDLLYGVKTLREELMVEVLG